jgi:anti-anti-sigma factor
MSSPASTHRVGRFMDSASLRVLMSAHGKLTADGGSLILRNPSRAAQRLLTAAQAEHLLRTDPADHDARPVCSLPTSR